MTPLYYAVSAILLGWHWLFAHFGFLSTGWIWALSIAGLTITVRALLIPLYVKQIKSSRNMQLLQPKIKELQKKYGHDRQKLAEEQMKLWKETGTNPFASCLPMILQIPVFFALYSVISHASKGKPRGVLTSADAASLKEAILLGGRIADSFMHSAHLETKLIAITLVVAMSVSQFVTMRQLMMKNMPPDALTGPFAQQQKLMMYIFPVIFAVSGVAFPIGVLIYWTVSNLWTGAQQWYVIRNNPSPGTPAFHAKQLRDAKRGKSVQEDPLEELEHPHPKPGRQQPRNQSRNQRKKKGGGKS